MEQFTIHLTIGPRTKSMFRLTYEDVLKRKLMQYDIDIKVKPKQLVHHFEVDCRGPPGPGRWSQEQGSCLSLTVALALARHSSCAIPDLSTQGRGLTPQGEL